MSGYYRIIEFFNEMKGNYPVTINEIEEYTKITWSGIKKILLRLKDEYHLNLRKSGNSLIIWKGEGPLRPKIEDSCNAFLE